MPFTQKIRHFLSHVAYTSNKDKVAGNPGPSENWRWTSLGIADSRRKFEWQEFWITLKVVCYFLLYCSYSGSQDKLGKKKEKNKNPKTTINQQNPGKFLSSFQFFCINPVGSLWNTQEWKYMNETVIKGVFILWSSIYFHLSLKHCLFRIIGEGLKLGKLGNGKEASTLIKHLSRSRLLL